MFDKSGLRAAIGAFILGFSAAFGTLTSELGPTAMLADIPQVGLVTAVLSGLVMAVHAYRARIAPNEP